MHPPLDQLRHAVYDEISGCSLSTTRLVKRLP
jgi:hypothetical protein